MLDGMPTASQAACLSLTYTCEAGFGPTRITSSSGMVRPCCFRCSILFLTSLFNAGGNFFSVNQLSCHVVLAYFHFVLLSKGWDCITKKARETA